MSAERRDGERLFHLVVPAELERARADRAPAWTHASLASEGFLHLSFADQLAGALEVHFDAHAGPLELWEVDARGVADALRLEPSRGGARFPHLHRALAWHEIARRWVLTRERGRWTLPALGSLPGDDRPAGTAGPPTV